MIVLFLADGLGNQMFQYAFVRSLQLKTNKKLGFSLMAFKNDLANRNYSLDKLNISKEIEIVPERWEKILLFRHKLYNKIRVLCGSNPSKIYVGSNMINAQCNDVYGFVDYSRIQFSNHVTVRGYFQSFKYFEDYENVIRNELKVKTDASEENVKILKEISSVNSVCVHIRRGDYLNPRWSNLNICDYNYYCKAMKIISEKAENPVFYVFSNTHQDIEWIKKNYDFSEYNVKYVNLNNPDYEELRLMYSCNHFIISNSTFSWWAQYLGEYDDKLVVAPSEWNREVEDCRGIYMPEWIIVDVDKKS